MEIEKKNNIQEYDIPIWLKKCLFIVGTGKALAKALGVSPMTVSHWKNRKHLFPNALVVDKIEKLTGGEVTLQSIKDEVFEYAENKSNRFLKWLK